MTEQHYLTSMEALKKEYESKVTVLSCRYAMETHSVNVGDIVQCNESKEIIKVENIKFCAGSFLHKILPYCNFYGQTLKKDLTPTKKIIDGRVSSKFCVVLKRSDTK